jgi:hypothetical protein
VGCNLFATLALIFRARSSESASDRGCRDSSRGEGRTLINLESGRPSSCVRSVLLLAPSHKTPGRYCTAWRSNMARVRRPSGRCVVAAGRGGVRRRQRTYLEFRDRTTGRALVLSAGEKMQTPGGSTSPSTGIEWRRQQWTGGDTARNRAAKARPAVPLAAAAEQTRSVGTPSDGPGLSLGVAMRWSRIFHQRPLTLHQGPAGPPPARWATQASMSSDSSKASRTTSPVLAAAKSTSRIALTASRNPGPR